MSLLDTLDALEVAAGWLTQPCPACTCPKSIVNGLDVDPDCPGLHQAAGGCLSHSHVAARVALADAGIPAPQGKRDWLRTRVLTMYADLAAELEAIEVRTRVSAAAAEALLVKPSQPAPDPLASMTDLHDTIALLAQAALGGPDLGVAGVDRVDLSQVDLEHRSEVAA